MKDIITFSVIAIVVLLCSGLFVPYNVFNYSEGERVGSVSKVSTKGVFCKTHEGYMLINPENQIAPEKFYFTVKNDSVLQDLQRYNGQTVSVTYNQYLFASSCWGGTDYEVTSVSLIN